jgi:hypothetical protein
MTPTSHFGLESVAVRGTLTLLVGVADPVLGYQKPSAGVANRQGGVNIGCSNRAYA